MLTKPDDRTLGQLFAELSRETKTLVQQEIQLAKTELSEKASKMAHGAGLVAAAAALAYAGVLALVAALILGLVAIGLMPWLAALIGAVVVVASAGILLKLGLAALKPAALVPRKTIHTLKENAQWLGSQTR